MKEPTEPPRHVYGPVPSRRLGLSLGVDILPLKTCTFDCVYCQLGKTALKCVERERYTDPRVVVQQIREMLSQKQKLDYITFSGSGEPTLHSDIGLLIAEVKRITAVPVAVITNSSLLYDEAVREALLSADLVVPSLDAGTERTFRSINRPHESIGFNDMVEGLVRFSREFSGELWLEIMLVAGMNDTDDEVNALCTKLQETRISKIQLNTIFRPPAEPHVRPVDGARIERIRDMFGDIASTVTDFRGNMQESVVKHDEQRILELIRRRPVTVPDIVASLGIHRDEVIKHLAYLEKQNRVRSAQFENRRYYEPL